MPLLYFRGGRLPLDFFSDDYPEIDARLRAVAEALPTCSTPSRVFTCCRHGMPPRRCCRCLAVHRDGIITIYSRESREPDFSCAERGDAAFILRVVGSMPSVFVAVYAPLPTMLAAVYTVGDIRRDDDIIQRADDIFRCSMIESHATPRRWL